MAKPDPAQLKARIRAGENVLGAFVFLPSPAVVEILAEAGFDFVIIDQEHSPRNPETVENMIRAAQARGIAALVRVERNEPIAILHALEAGAGGVVVPFIRDASDVRSAVAAMHYPPRGARGLCTQTRAAHYGALRTEFVAHAAARAEQLLLIGLIEDPSGIANIADITTVEDGLDAMLIGRGDLAATMGHLGHTDAPEVREAVLGAIHATVAGQQGMPRVRAGMTVFNAAECQAWRELGCNVFVAASEASLFLTAARQWAVGAADAALPAC
ncbi:MAG: siderophore biosynthesis protein SbnG [Burkholderiaceae bacterium]|nr:siderophore biosynthesis protein SbnG [Burkholderiaceae bacterium]